MGDRLSGCNFTGHECGRGRNSLLVNSDLIAYQLTVTRALPEIRQGLWRAGFRFSPVEQISVTSLSGKLLGGHLRDQTGLTSWLVFRRGHDRDHGRGHDHG